MREDFIDIPSFENETAFQITLAGVSYCDGTYKIKRKNSDCFCLEYIISGKGYIETKEKTYQASTGDIYLLHIGKDHYYYSDVIEPWTKIWINFSGYLAESLIDAYKLTDKILFRYNGEEYFKKIHNVLNTSDLSYEEKMNITVIILHELLQKLAMMTNSNDEKQSEATVMKEFIEENVYSSITSKKLSSLIYKSPSQAIRIFKSAYGIPPYEYFIDVKIKKAISLLKNTSLTVKEIAYKLNFCDEHYFSNIFKRRTGKVPSDYRK